MLGLLCLAAESNALPSSGTATFLTNVNVRSGPSTSYSIVAMYSTGETCYYDSVVTGDGRTWISYISYSGARRYCCAIDRDGSQYISAGGSSGSSSGSSSSGSSSGGTLMNIPLYYQWEYKQSYGDGTIATCGCGPASFSMIASYLKGYTITPYDAIKWCGNSYYCWGAGTYWSYFQAAATHFGLGTLSQVYDSGSMTTALRNKKPVISNQGPGIFTKGGHFIVLRGITAAGRIRVCDPNDNTWSKNYYNRAFSVSEVHSTNKCYWIFRAK